MGLSKRSIYSPYHINMEAADSGISSFRQETFSETPAGSGEQKHEHANMHTDGNIEQEPCLRQQTVHISVSLLSAV
jgi:hypothetical protein